MNYTMQSIFNYLEIKAQVPLGAEKSAVVEEVVEPVAIEPVLVNDQNQISS